YDTQLDDDGRMLIGFIKKAASQLKGLVDGLLAYSKSDSILKEKGSYINLIALRKDILGLFAFDNSVSIEISSVLGHITTNRTAIDQILINLVSNAIKYNDKESTEIKINVVEHEEDYTFTVVDNGPGIPEEEQQKIFQIFKVLAPTDRYGESGNGIGLATVKRITEKMGGTINLESAKGEGCKFIFNLKKLVHPPEELQLAK
ncbi:MAG: HAMP domain-containing sensor histidine kinase, partial [Maribacter sp.]|uniref:sensor histidine kinase n=1 Tax=Maribacter sp. TaxID=1897614 RepID=UPI003C71F1C5